MKKTELKCDAGATIDITERDGVVEVETYDGHRTNTLTFRNRQTIQGFIDTLEQAKQCMPDPWKRLVDKLLEIYPDGRIYTDSDTTMFIMHDRCRVYSDGQVTVYAQGGLPPAAVYYAVATYLEELRSSTDRHKND